MEFNEARKQNALMAMTGVDPAAVAAAESAKARIQSAYIMALQKPRSIDQARSVILKRCQDPEFAELAEYNKPIDRGIKGPSIRLAEVAIQAMENILVDIKVVFENDDHRRVSVICIDLETNIQYNQEVTINKTVERRNRKGRQVVDQRLNSSGKLLYIVKATDDELLTKENALISKAIRTQGLRLIPGHIIAEAIQIARQTVANRDSEDPEAAKKKVLDSFTGLGIMPKEIQRLLGHGLDSISPQELVRLRQIYATINTGESTWADYLAEIEEREAARNGVPAADPDPGKGTPADYGAKPKPAIKPTPANKKRSMDSLASQEPPPAVNHNTAEASTDSRPEAPPPAAGHPDWNPQLYRNARKGNFDITGDPVSWTGFAGYVYNHRSTWPQASPDQQRATLAKWQKPTMYGEIPFLLNLEGKLITPPVDAEPGADNPGTADNGPEEETGGDVPKQFNALLRKHYDQSESVVSG